MTDHEMPSAEDRNARDLLAPIYGEARTLETTEAASFEATRDLVGDWMRPSVGDVGLSVSARASLLNRVQASTPAARVSTLMGRVMIRRAGAVEAFPLGADPEVRRGDVVIAPHGVRALVTLPDGSEILLRAESEVEIGDLDTASLSERLMLASGRLYAWIAKQTEGLFTIRTDAGFACVVGTEFDLQTDREGNLALIVTHGQVNFKPASGSSEEIPLRRNDMIEYRAKTATKRTLAAREAAQRTAWARKPESGRVHGAVVAGVIALALAIGGGFYLKSRNETTPMPLPITNATSGSTSAPNAANTENSAGDVFNYRLTQPEGENTITTSISKGDLPGIGPVEYRMVMQTTSAPGSPEMRIVVSNDADIVSATGAPIPPQMNSYAAMRGLAMTFTRDASGKIVDVKRERAEAGSDEFSSFIFLATMNAQPFDRAGLKKGDEWDHRVSGTVPSVPGASYEVDMKYRFDGFTDTADGRVAILTSRGTITLKDAPLSTETTNNFTQRLMVNSMVIEQSSTTTYEAATSRIISAVNTSTTKMDMEFRRLVPGRDPSIQKLPEMTQVQNGTLFVEYK